MTDSTSRPSSYKGIGIGLACVSGILIGTSFIFKKKGLLQATERSNKEAGEGFAYLKNYWWWLGMSMMIGGELLNAAAYGFTDAIIITSLGGLSVVTSAILSSICLKERLSFVGKMSCVLCLVGSTAVVMNAPEENTVSTIQGYKKLIITPGFLTYGGVCILLFSGIAFFLGPRYGKKSMFIYISVCSLAGGLTVVLIQAVGSAITAQARGTMQFNQWFLYLVIVVMVALLVIEIIYLNKALNIFNTAVVSPTYYVMFTTMTIISSAVLFKGFSAPATQIVNMVLGFLTACFSIVLLQISVSTNSISDSTQLHNDLNDVREIISSVPPEDELLANETFTNGNLGPSMSVLIRDFSKRRRSKQLARLNSRARTLSQNYSLNEGFSQLRASNGGGTHRSLDPPPRFLRNHADHINEDGRESIINRYMSIPGRATPAIKEIDEDNISEYSFKDGDDNLACYDLRSRNNNSINNISNTSSDSQGSQMKNNFNTNSGVIITRSPSDNEDIYNKKDKSSESESFQASLSSSDPSDSEINQRSSFDITDGLQSNSSMLGDPEPYQSYIPINNRHNSFHTKNLSEDKIRLIDRSK